MISSETETAESTMEKKIEQDVVTNPSEDQVDNTVWMESAFVTIIEYSRFIMNYNYKQITVPFLQHNLWVLMQAGTDVSLNPLDRAILVGLWKAHCLPPYFSILSLQQIESLPIVIITLAAYEDVS